LLSVALLTSNAVTSDGIEQLIQESGVFRLVAKLPIRSTHEMMRTLGMHDPELILVDLGDWDMVAALARQIMGSRCRGVAIGFKPKWNRVEQLTFEDAGIVDLIRSPFSHYEFETVVYDALHRGHAVTDDNIVALLPAKAGGGCSTIALNAAAALADGLAKKVLLIEGDRRSGILSIMLNLENRLGLSEALQQAGDLTAVDWQQYSVWVSGIHLLPANPSRRGPLPTWAEYYQLLRFAQKHYDFIFVDLPEVVNEATAEVVKSARTICIVCTPEVPSLKMAGQRSAELEACGIPRDRIQIVLNRCERGGLPTQDVEGILERPVFASLPNDYRQVKNAILESRLVSPDSRFAKSCRTLAQKLSGLPEAPRAESKFTLLRELVRTTG
jgi:MinD-like ATPase involved in chromosome partitioning or flagellar assembly